MNEQVISGSGRKRQEVIVSGGSLAIDTTGLATSAKQDTQTTELTSIKTAVETIDNAIAGTEMQVDVVTAPAIATGDNTIGRVKVTDGTTVATVRELGTNDALNVAITDGSGNQVTSFGGGTQYTEGDTDASITGTAIMWEDAADTLRAVSASKPLPVDIQDATIAVTQSGTWDEVGINDSGNSITVDNGGTFAVQDSEKLADNTGFTDGTTKVMPTGYIYDEVAGTALTENDIAAARINANRAQVSTIEDGTTRGRYATVTASNALKVDGSAVTQPVSGSLTSAGNVTNAGTFVVQENGAALTALQLIDDPIATDDTTTHSTGTTKVMGIGAVATPTDASVNANDIGMPAMTTDRKLHVSVQDALPAGTNAIGKLAANSGVDIGDVDVTSIIAGTGATNLGKARDSAIGATDTGVAMLGVRRDTPTAETPAAGDYVVPQYSANGEAWVRLAGELADDAAFTVGTTRVLPTGLLADETSPDSVNEGDIGIPRMTLDRKAIVTSYPSSTTGDGLSVANFNSGDTFTALTNTAQVIKASAGNFYGYYIYNPNSSATYVMLYNTAAASVTVGTTTPAMVFCIPATSGANLSLTYPIPFTNAGWSIAAATTGGGNTAPTTALEAMIFYK